MGEKIVKKIRGMSWTAKISLMLVFTLMVSIFMYQGWYLPKWAHGANITSTATGGTWSNIATWVGGVVPGAGDNVTIASGATVTVTDARSAASVTLSGGAAAATLNINAGQTLTVSGAVTLNAPTANVTNQVSVGAGTLSAGSITITGGASAARISNVLINTGTATVSGDITFGAGNAASQTITFSGSGTLNIAGNLGTGGTLTPLTGTVNFNGTSAQTAGGYTYNIVKVNNAAGLTMTAASTIPALTIGDVTASSVFSDGGFQVTSTGTLNLTSGTFKLGSATVATTFPGFTTRNINAGTTVEYASGIAQTVSGTPTYSNLTLSGAGTKTLGAATTVNGNLNISAGTLDVSASNFALTVKGNWTNNGTFTAQSGTVTFNGTGSQTINNANTWYGLTITAASARTVYFQSSVAQIIAANGSLTLTGASGQLLTLAPLTAATTWLLNVNATGVTQSISYVSVSYSNASGGTTINASNGTNVNGGNNTNWSFLAAPGTLQFSSATYTVAESGPTATITVTRTGGSSGAVGVTYATSNGTATQPADYTTASGTLSWADGDSANKTFTVSIINDTLDEANETVDLTLSSPTGGATLGAQSTAVLTITDDDPTPTVAFAAASSSGAESVTPALMAVNLSAASGLTVTVNYSIGGTATGGGVDYTLAAGTLTFTPGVTTQNISATIVNDTLDEADETIIVTLAGPTNATLGAQTTHTYTITDNDTAPTVAFAAASSSGAESVTPALMAVNLSAASGLTVTVNYSTGGTATGGGVDYTLAAGTLTFTPGVTTQNISATIVDDALVEANETIIVTLAGPVNATLGGQITHTYTIIDNDAPAVTQTLDSFTDNSANTPLPVTNLPMATIASTATGGGVALTPTRVSVGGTVAAADVASIRVLWGAAQVGIVNNPAGLINIDIALAGAGSGTNNLVYQISLNASATGKTFNLTVTSVTGRTADNIPLPKTTATRIAGINMLMHNSVTLSSTKWAPNGWGIASGKYGEFTCGTCHAPRATNIKGIKNTVITSPNTPTDKFPAEVGSKAPIFTATTGNDSFGNDATNSPRPLGSTRICEVCHTYDATQLSGVNAHPYLVGAALPNHYSADNTDCTSCHKHNVGFKGMGCDSCHGNPPIVNTLGGPTGLANDPGVTGSQTAGSHNMHKNTLGYDCSTCHNSYTMPDPSQDIDIGFSMFGKNGTGTTYNGQLVVLSYTGKNNTIVTKTGSAGGSNLTCSGLYCHGSTLTAGSLTSPWWDGTGTVTCGTCHGASVGTSPTAVNHPRHAGSGAGGLSVACTDCHSATAGAQGHVNGDVSWSLNTGSSKFGSGAIYRTGASGSTGGTAPSASYGTCSTVYCHSNVQNGTAGGGPTSYGTPTWGAASVSCSQGVTGCHGNAPATPTANNAHGTHTTGNYLFACSACHNNGGDESANHANGTLNMTISATYGGTYSQGDHAPAPVSLGYGTCSNTYCHGNYTGSGGASLTPSWAGAVACGDCHKYLNTNPPTPGSHGRHAGQAAGQLNLTCAKCHEPARVLGDGHVNLSVQWDIDRTDTKFGTGATYRGTESGATGLKAPSVPYGNCGSVYCHSSVQSGNGTGAPLSYDTPTWGVASVTCDSCHGQGAGVNDGSPSTGSHPVHVATYAYTCSVCHTGHGDETATHTNRTINLAFDAATAGGSAAYTGDNVPQSGAFGNCTNTFCHGGSSNTSAEVGNWGTSLSASDACTICHGTKTPGVDGSAAAINRAPGGNGTGVDTNGDTAATDAQVGAHDTHLRSSNNYSSDIACTQCHTVPAATVAGIKGHLGALPADMTWGALATTNSATPGYTSPNCTNTYCHFGKSIGLYPPATANASVSWTNTAYLNGTPSLAGDCGKCHLSPPATTGAHNGVNNINQCITCHNHVLATGAFSDVTKHINGLVEAQADCVGCHAGTQGNRAKIVGGSAGSEGDDFIRASRHVSDGTNTNQRVTNFDCILCHVEGDTTSSGTNIVTTAEHITNNLVGLRNMDNYGNPGTLNTNYWRWPGWRKQAFTATTTDRNNMDTFCMNCHDANGSSTIAVNNTNPANGMITTSVTTTNRLDSGGLSVGKTVNLRPFNVFDNLQNNYDKATALGTYRTTTYGRVLDVKAQFNSTNAVGKSWASHHNLNQFTKRYSTRNTTAWPAAAWTTYVTKEGVTINSATGAELAGLHCSDCHLNEANAHGTRLTRYMLSDKNGADAAFVFDTKTETNNTIVCLKCHAPLYGMATFNSKGVDERVAAHAETGRCANPTPADNYFALECLDCHGGIELGDIHGTNATYNPGNGAGTTKRYRFMSGAVQRYYSPDAAVSPVDADWELASGSFGCYTTGAADTWGSGNCTSHKSGFGTDAINRSRLLQY